MERKREHRYRSMLALVLATVLMITTVMLTPATLTKAATVPGLTKTEVNILEGKNYDLNVTNWNKNYTCKWSTSNKWVATVSKRGVVTGIKKGKATITCNVTTPERTYQLACKVTIRKPATKMVIRNKVTFLNLGQTYDFHRNLSPANSNDKITWISSDKDIANPDEVGKFVALKTGTVTITGKMLSGETDSVTFTVIDKEGIVTNQEELDQLLNSGVAQITIKTEKAENFVIPLGNYKKVSLIVDAPNSDVTNYGLFSSIVVKQIKADTVAAITVPAPQPNNQFNEFTELNQTAIVTEMGAGWNLGNQLEAVLDGFPGETFWGNPVITEKLIKAVKAAGFQSIRIPVSYINYIGDAPTYTVNEGWLDRIQEVVDYCIKNDLYVVVNMHGDGYKTITGGWLICDADDQETIKAKYAAVWSQVATRFKDYDEHLIFESMNEVFDGSYNEPVASAYANINAYNQVFVDAIRKAGGNNDRRWLLIPGWNTNIDYTAGDYGFVIPQDNYLSDKVPAGEKRLMISVHYYAPWDFCGGETGEITQWGESATNPSKVSTHSGQSYMAAQFKSLYDSFTLNGYPVVIGEYGSIDKSMFDTENTYYRSYFARKLCENSVKYGCIPMIWDNGYNGKFGFGIFDRVTTQVRSQEIIDAIMGVYNGSNETGTSTGITISQSELKMAVGDDAVTLTASLIPANSTDTIKWSSSDESIATISDSGIVRAQTIGTTIITASANGNTAQCTVTVTASANLKIGFYALETVSWSSVKSSTNADVSQTGGTYTLSLTGSKEMLSKIGSLYLKDLQVVSGMSKVSLFESAKITVESVTFNDNPLTVRQTSAEEAVNNKVFDFCILNQWAVGTEKVVEAEIGDTGSYYITAADYQDSNTIEVTFTISDIVVAEPVEPIPEPEPEPEPEPVGDTATPITSITYDFSIAGVEEETSLKFVNTAANYVSAFADVALDGDGEYSFTITVDNAASMVNMGYFETVSGSAITASLEEITVNDTYEFAYAANLIVGSENDNGLKNIWNVSEAGTKIVEADNGYIALNTDKSGLVFYVVAPKEPTVTPITSIKYDFTLTGVNAETSLNLKYTNGSWADGIAKLDINGDGDYSILISLENSNGMINLGYIETIEDSTITAHLNKATINNTYELNYVADLIVSSSDNNGLKNIWNSAAGKIAEGTDSYLEFDADAEDKVIYFYVK